MNKHDDEGNLTEVSAYINMEAAEYMTTPWGTGFKRCEYDYPGGETVENVYNY